MKPFDVDTALKLANKDLTPYTDLKIRDMRRALRMACAEIKYLRDELEKLQIHHTKVCDDRVTIWEERNDLRDEVKKLKGKK